MAYFLIAVIGAACGGFCVYMALESKRRRLDEAVQAQTVEARRLENDVAACRAKERLLADLRTQFEAAKSDFERRVLSYSVLQDENALLKRDLRNLDLHIRKLQLDHGARADASASASEKVELLAKRYLKDVQKWIGDSLTASNFASSKERLVGVIAWCREAGYSIAEAEERSLVEGLRAEFEHVVRVEYQRQEQARIKAKIREEQKLEREIQRELQRLERERQAIQAALSAALQRAKDEHSAEVEQLRARLAEAEAKSARAVSQAQLTRSGNVYVISNIGSFGEGVFKIGMTRRLEPSDRIRELGDASVPFAFDVHMVIASDDAPALENALHRALHRQRVNKANPKKEFFRADLSRIIEIVKNHHGEIEYVAEPEALEYRQSVTMSADDQEFIESVYDRVADDGNEGDEGEDAENLT